MSDYQGVKMTEMSFIINRLNRDYSAITSESEAVDAIKELTELHTAVAERIEDTLSMLAVKFQIEVSIGEYGSCRSVVLEKTQWDEHNVGDWLSSSHYC